MLIKFSKLLIIFIFLSILGYLYFKYDPINNLLFPKCPLLQTTGIYCPGCGSQRATHALLHFDILNVFRSNLLFIPTAFIIIYHFGIQIINRILNTHYTSILDHSKAPVVTLIIVILFWVLRNIPSVPFSFLAP